VQQRLSAETFTKMMKISREFQWRVDVIIARMTLELPATRTNARQRPTKEAIDVGIN
jgi:hypothetical protein